MAIYRYMAGMVCISCLACNNLDLKKGQIGTKDEKARDSADLSQANEPVMVGGSFLVCADDPYQSENSESAFFGCRIEDLNGEKDPLVAPSVEDIIAIVDKQELQPVFAGAEASSFWHWLFEYDASQRSSYQVVLLNEDIPAYNREAEVMELHQGLVKEKEMEQGNYEEEQDAVDFPGYHIIFTTSELYRPGGTTPKQFNSLAAADQICQKHARQASLDGRFIALLADDELTLQERVNIKGPVILPSGEAVGNENNFWSPRRNRAIPENENGQTIDGGTIKVWTGSPGVGRNRSDESNCKNWTADDSDNKGGFGLAGDRAGNKWMYDGEEPCDKALHLYCISL